MDIIINYTTFKPKRATKGSVGFDLAIEGVTYSNGEKFAIGEAGSSGDGFVIPPGQRVMIDNGIRVKFPPSLFGLLFLRSSMSKRGVIMANSVGVIDSDYLGPIMIPVINISSEEVVMDLGERIGQLVFMQNLCSSEGIELTEVSASAFDSFSSERGAGGFGSTNNQ